MEGFTEPSLANPLHELLPRDFACHDCRCASQIDALTRQPSLVQNDRANSCHLVGKLRVIDALLAADSKFRFRTHRFPFLCALRDRLRIQ